MQSILQLPNLESRKLFLVRTNAEQVDRLSDFIEHNMIGIGWGNLPSLSGMSRDEISRELATVGYSAPNPTVGLINHIVNNMSPGDLCIIPEPDSSNVYIAEILGDYGYKHILNCTDFPHQRSVRFLNLNNPLDRTQFPSELNKALKPMMTIADVTHRLGDLIAFLRGEPVDVVGFVDLKGALTDLLPKAIENLRMELESANEDIRFRASVKVLELLSGLE